MDKRPFHELDQFVGVFDNFYNDRHCDLVIDYFQKLKKHGFVYDRQDGDNAPKHVKNDLSSELIQGGKPIGYDESPRSPDESRITSINCENWHLPSNILLETLWERIYPIYEREYSTIGLIQKKLVCYSKIQETKPGEGYHIWHHEIDRTEATLRLMAFILYLNDVEEGGETEFLYQKKRIKAVKNRFLLWPAGFTHTHRGNPPLSNTKYILTGHILMC